MSSNEDKFANLLTSLENVTNLARKTRHNKSYLVIQYCDASTNLDQQKNVLTPHLCIH